MEVNIRVDDLFVEKMKSLLAKIEKEEKITKEVVKKTDREKKEKNVEEKNELELENSKKPKNTPRRGMIDVRTILMFGLMFVMLAIVVYIVATVNNQTKTLALQNNDTQTVQTIDQINNSFNQVVTILISIAIISLFVAFAIWMYKQSNGGL